jgi:hypothetical protein
MEQIQPKREAKNTFKGVKVGKSEKFNIDGFKCVASTEHYKKSNINIDIPFYYQMNEVEVGEEDKMSDIVVQELKYDIRRFKSHLYPYMTKAINDIFQGIRNNNYDYIKDLIIAEITTNTVRKFWSRYNYGRIEISLFLNNDYVFDDVQFEMEMLCKYIVDFIKVYPGFKIQSSK